MNSAGITKPYLALWSLLLGGTWLLTWAAADQPLVWTPAGYIAPIVLLSVFYALMLGFMLLHHLGLKSYYFINLLLLAGITACLVHFIAAVFDYLSLYHRVWDDAFMFMRYVHNLRVYGVLAWNIEDGAAYGSTELLHLALAWAYSWLTGIDAPHLTIQLASLTGGTLFLLLCGVLVWRMVRTGLTGRLFVLFLMSIGLVIHTPFLREHFISGMGTTTDMAYLLAYLLLLHRYVQTPSKRMLYITGVWGGLAYFARPDLVLFSTICLLLMVIFAENPASRRRAFALGSITLAVILAELVLAQIVFGTALPLPFYIKSISLSGKDYIYHTYGDVPGEQLDEFLYNNLYFLVLILPAMCVPGRAIARWGIPAVGAIAAAVLFVAYYRFFVMQLMYYQQRFYYPVLPVILFMTAGALGVSLEAFWQRCSKYTGFVAGISAPVVLAAVIMGAVLFFPAALVQDVQLIGLAGAHILRQPDREEYAIQLSGYMPELWALSNVAPNLVAATTEVGMISVLNPDWYIYDLSGLNNTKMAFDGFSADDFFAKQPDLIYMPWPEYLQILNGIRGYPTFAHDYEVFTGEDLAAPFDMAIRKTSVYYGQMHGILEQRVEHFLPPHEPAK